MKQLETSTFNHVYLSSLDASRLASDDISNYWRQIGLAEEISQQVELCVVEMVNNAFIHAYDSQDGLPIELSCDLDEQKQQLHVRISDKGSVMTQSQFKQALANEFIEPDPSDDETWTTSGRGFVIVSCLMDRVELSTMDDKNTYLMVKQLELS